MSFFVFDRWEVKVLLVFWWWAQLAQNGKIVVKPILRRKKLRRTYWSCSICDFFKNCMIAFCIKTVNISHHRTFNRVLANWWWLYSYHIEMISFIQNSKSFAVFIIMVADSNWIWFNLLADSNFGTTYFKIWWK